MKAKLDRIRVVALASLALSAATSAHAQKTFEGLNFGVGLGLVFPFDKKDGAAIEAEVDGNNIIRITKESKRTPAIFLESHYLFAAKADGIPWYCAAGNTCSHGPFVAIQAGAEGQSTISAYGLGWMLAYKRGNAKEDTASWNIGLAYVVRSNVQVLGDGLQRDTALPTGDKLRYKTISQPGWMWMSSFSF